MNISAYKLGARFYDRIWKSFTAKTLIEVVRGIDFEWLSHQAQPQRLLDIACGTGELETRLLSRNSEIYITGLDNSSQMLAQAKHKFASDRHIAFVQGNANLPLPFLDGSFDVVVSTNALHYLVKPEQFLGEVGRVLKADGRLLIEDFTIHGRLFWRGMEKLIRLLDPPYQKTYVLGDLQPLLIKTGFVIKDSRTFKIDIFWRGMYLQAIKQS